jgi:hypothetical protein
MPHLLISILRKIGLVPLKSFLPILFSLILTSSVPLGQRYQVTYQPGEEIRYRVHYGFFNAGEAIMRVTNQLFRVNNRICFRAEVVGNSTGAFDRIVRIRDVWGSYFDTINFQPQKSFRSIAENRYRKKEEIFFDYGRGIARIQSENSQTEEIPVQSNVQDMVSGYYFLRLQKYDNLRKNDTIRLSGIFENKTYNFKIVYLGKEKVKTKFGKANSFVISPVMPDNKLFSGRNPIKMWISDDDNRIPLKIEAELLLGSLDLDISDHKNLKHPLLFD